jgi:prephenate dehydrogenase
LFAELLAAGGADVVCVDPAAAADPGGAVARHTGDLVSPDQPTRELIASADVLVLAVPEPVAVAALPAIARSLPPGALLVDTLSVKALIADEVLRRLPCNPALSLNPMFAPALGFAGRVVAASILRDGARIAELLDLIRGAGAEVVTVTAQEHDRITAVTQAATHAAVLAFGLAAAELGVDIDTLRKLAPPPHQTLLALLARIASGAPEVYWDIQAANASAADARAALRAGLDRIDAASVTAAGQAADVTDFALLLGSVRDFLGDGARAQLAEDCRAVFGALSHVPPPAPPSAPGPAPAP